MDRKFINQAGLSYETPTLKTLDIMSEGVLCGSGNFGIADWDEDGESLNF